MNKYIKAAVIIVSSVSVINSAVLALDAAWGDGTGNCEIVARVINSEANRAARDNLSKHIELHFMVTSAAARVASEGGERCTALLDGNFTARGVVGQIIAHLATMNKADVVRNGASLAFGCKIRDLGITGGKVEYWQDGKLVEQITKRNAVQNCEVECHLHFDAANDTLLRPGDGQGNGATGSIWVALDH
jgi:hypothetical protein